MKGEECRSGKSCTKTIHALRLDADTQNSLIALLQGEELGFPQELQPDGNFNKKSF